MYHIIICLKNSLNLNLEKHFVVLNKQGILRALLFSGHHFPSRFEICVTDNEREERVCKVNFIQAWRPSRLSISVHEFLQGPAESIGYTIQPHWKNSVTNQFSKETCYSIQDKYLIGMSENQRRIKKEIPFRYPAHAKRFPINPVMRFAMTAGMVLSSTIGRNAFTSLLLSRVNNLTWMLTVLVNFMILFSSPFNLVVLFYHSNKM